MDNKELLQKDIEIKTKELDILHSKILSEKEDTHKELFEQQKIKVEEEIHVLQEKLDELKELEIHTTSDQTSKETQVLKETIDIDADWSYEIIQWSKMHDKLLTILWTEDKVEIFALQIDAVVRKYLDQELLWFSHSIKNSMSVGIQFAMMETLIKQWAQWSTQFFDAFSLVKSDSSSKAFEWLYTAFGTLWSVNEFYMLANKVQNITWYLSDKKDSIINIKNIPELMNPLKFKELLKNKLWSNPAQLDTIDIGTLLTLDVTDPIDIHAGDDELRKIVNNDAILWVITKETITSIQNSLKTADNLLDSRQKFTSKTSDLISTIAWFLDIDLPFLWNVGEMMGMKFPTDILWEQKDWWVLNFVLGVLGFRGWVSWLHKEYIREKLDELSLDDSFVSRAYSDFQKNIDTRITHDVTGSTWKICSLDAANPSMEATTKAKIPADYHGLKKSLVDTIDISQLDPTVVANFAPETIIIENNIAKIDTSKIQDTLDDFIDKYLKYIIPLLAEDKFITSKKVDQNSFILAVMWGLIGDKYFIEGVRIWLIFPPSSLPVDPLPPETIREETSLDVANGSIDFTTWKFSSEQIKNIKFIIEEMKAKKITDPYTQIGILSVIGKESWFIPQSEHSYANTPNKDIRKIFWNRVPKSDDELTQLKNVPQKFFNKVYAKTVGNQWGNDGWTYRGRGYNQLTGKANYKKYAALTNTDILNNPDILNDPIVASKVALAFFTQKKNVSQFPLFTNKRDAAIYFADINAGGRAGGHRSDALQIAQSFDIETSIA